MKNYWVMTAVTTALFVLGCSNDEYTDVAESKAISFENAFVDKSTRAADLDAFSLSEFVVNGYQGTDLLFNGQTVTKTDAGDWTYTPVKYWVAGASYSFMAVAGGTVTSKNLTDGTLSTSISFSNDGETDPLASAQVNQTGSLSSPVEFTFKHLLSKVKFTFENGFAYTDDVTLKVKDIEITDAYTQGVATVSGTTPNISWDVTDAAETLDLKFGDTETIEPPSTASASKNSSSAANTKYLIPSSDKDYTVKLSIEVYANYGTDDELLTATYDHEITLSGVTFQPGYSYNLTASLTAKNVSDEELLPIQFSVTGVSKWVDATDVTVIE